MSNQNGAASKNHTQGGATTEPLIGRTHGSGNDDNAAVRGAEFTTGRCKGNDVISGLVSSENGKSTFARTTVTLHACNQDSNENKSASQSGESTTGRKLFVANASSGKQRYSFGTPPDGGWGWVVVFSSFVISMLVDGVCFSFGIFFEHFRSEFELTKATTSWIGSVLNGTYLLIGPIVSALVNVYGCRIVAMSGAVLASFALFISTFSTNIGVLIFTYGFMGGFGFGLMYLPAIVMVGYYFERRRALATGIACCGSGMGAFIFAPFCEYLLQEYGWRGATWIIAGLVLNGVVFALFYRPLPDPRSSFPTVESDTESASSIYSEAGPEIDVVSAGAQTSPRIMVVPTITIEKVDSEKSLMSGKKTDSSAPPISRELKSQIYDLLQGEVKLTPSHRTRSVMLEELEQDNDPCRLARSTDFGMMLRKRCTAIGERSDHVKGGRGSTAAVGSSLPPLQRKDIFYSGSLMHLREYQELREPPSRGKKVSLDKSANRSAYDDLSQTNVAYVCNSPSQKSFSVAISSIFDFSLLKSPTFLVYGWACFLCMLGFFVPFVYIPAHAIDLGLGSQNAFLISIIGITNTVGRVGVGFISDQPWADCLLINNAALIVGGTATIFVPYYPSYLALAIYCAVFGMSVAVFVSLRSIIMVELMGLERLTTAFGFVIMCQGISAFMGAPIAGRLSDVYGNYNAAFCLAGISLTLSGVSCIPLRRVARWESEWARKKAERRMTAALAGAAEVDSSDVPYSKRRASSLVEGSDAEGYCDDGRGGRVNGRGGKTVRTVTTETTGRGSPVEDDYLVKVRLVGSDVDGRC